MQGDGPIGSQYELYWKNDATGAYARWVPDAEGVYLDGSGEVISLETLLNEEAGLPPILDVDLDGDGLNVGLDFQLINTIEESAGSPTVQSGSTQLGYGIQLFDGSTILIRLNGAIVSDSYPGGGWKPVAAVHVDDKSYLHYWKNEVAGTCARWGFDADGVYVAGSGVFISLYKLLVAGSTADFVFQPINKIAKSTDPFAFQSLLDQALPPGQIFIEEAALNEDLTGEGEVGPFAIKSGTYQPDVLFGTTNTVTLDLIGDDTLVADSSAGFDALMGDWVMILIPSWPAQVRWLWTSVPERMIWSFWVTGTYLVHSLLQLMLDVICRLQMPSLVPVLCYWIGKTRKTRLNHLSLTMVPLRSYEQLVGQQSSVDDITWEIWYDIVTSGHPFPSESTNTQA